MTERTRFLTRAAVAGLLVLVASYTAYFSWPREDYTAKIVMSSAANLATGANVWIKGFEVGSVMDIEVQDGKAVVTAGIKPEHAPLHEGTTARVQWYAALGERILTLTPGPAENAEIPDGGLIEAESVQVEVDQVLAALDQPTRENLNSFITRLESTTTGHEKDVQATLASAGPTVDALGGVLEAVGRDGPAIKSLVTQLQEMIQVAAQRQGEVAGVIDNLGEFSGNVAAKQGQLTESLDRLPGTLETANTTLEKVPAAVDSTNGLLEDLEPATAQLPSVAQNLSPLLKDLRPAIGELRPALVATNELLGRTPALMDSAHAVVPGVDDLLVGYQPAVSFLRPYTPEGVGWLQNWGKNFGAYDSQGHLWAAILGQAGPEAFNEHVVTPPPIDTVPEPKPGSNVGQPWDDPTLDATGSPIR